MTDRPSDRAIAQAFREYIDLDGATSNWVKTERVLQRAREIDAAAPEGAQGAVALPPIVKEVLEWYASDPTVWVAWNDEGWAKEDRAKKSGHYTFIGEDNRGHNQYVPNWVRAEEALAALKEWEENTTQPQPQDAAPSQVAEDAALFRWLAEHAEAVRAPGMKWEWAEERDGVRDETLVAAIVAARAAGGGG